MWRDGEKTLRDLVIEAKSRGFLIVNVVTNGTFPLNLPEADLILLSLDGDRDARNAIRGDTYDTILQNIDQATADNICLYMAINQMNRDKIRAVSQLAGERANIRAVSFNFHTPYPDTAALALSRQEKADCCAVIQACMAEGAPVFNLKSAFPYLIDNRFPTPCKQCVVMEDGKLSVCGRCIEVPGLCDHCGYFSMTRENFLGFGCSATTLLRDSFQINTFSIGEYEKKIDGGTLPTALTLHFTKRQRMIYYLFWTA